MTEENLVKNEENVDESIKEPNEALKEELIDETEKKIMKNFIRNFKKI